MSDELISSQGRIQLLHRLVLPSSNACGIMVWLRLSPGRLKELRKQGVTIGVAVMLTMVAMAWYLGWQLHEAQLARVASFASYYQVLNGYLQTTNNGLQSFAKTNSSEALNEAVSDMQTVERMAFPLLGLAPKAMSSLWSEFLDHDWNVVTRSLGQLATQNDYFSSSGLPENDRLFLQAMRTKLQQLAELMNAPTVSQGVVPGVRIRLDQLMEMDQLAGDLAILADCYVKNGMLPDKLPAPAISWQQAEQVAREAMELADAEWKLIGGEKHVTELRLGKDYHYLHFEPTSDYSGSMKGAVAGVDRQSGQLVRIEWTAQTSEELQPLTESELQQLALQVTADLSGEKQVIAISTENAAHPSAVVVLVKNDIPRLIDYVQVTFDPATGSVSKWENYSWDSEANSLSPRVSLATARDRLIAQVDLELVQVEDHGLVVVRSPYTHKATLVYWFTSATIDEQDNRLEDSYYVNARSGRLERIGSGW